MKANKALEKIWMDSEWIPHFDCKDCITENSVEYIREDVFIEKACEWLEQTLSPYIPYCNIDIDLAIEDFKKYMKGE